MDILEDFSKIKVLIIGDIMIDRYWWGSVDRISPEAPVPVVQLKNTTLTAGGAANVAANVAGLGATPILIGVTGKDEESDLFSKLLADLHIKSDGLLKIKDRLTTVKTRIIAHNQQVTRIDRETNLSLEKKDEAKLWKLIKKYLDTVDVIILSDYGKGVLTDNLLARVIDAAVKKNKFVLVDPKGKNFLKYKNASIITPNQRELYQAFNLDQIDPYSLEKIGKKVIFELGLQALLITQGEEGMTLLDKQRKTLRLKALAREVYDVTGAGDTVIAVMAVAIGAKRSLFESARLANIAAGLVVEQLGTTTIEITGLQQAEQRKNKKNS